MPQSKIISSSHCQINFKTQEIQSACDPYSKIVNTNSKKSTRGQLMLNTELITEAIKAANMKHKTHWNIDDSTIMSPVLETTEEETQGTSTDDVRTEENLPEPEIDYELEPPRPEVLSVRRRSRQFYPTKGESRRKEPEEGQLKKVPVFNLGRSLKQLYSRDGESEPKITEGDEVDGTDYPLDYDSDSGLLSKVKVYRPLRKIQSLPEMTQFGLEEEYGEIGIESIERSNSISNLARKWKQQNLEDVQKGPGYAFLAAVADNLRDKQAKNIALRADMSLAKVDKNKHATVSAGSEVAKQQSDNDKAKQAVTIPVSQPVVNVDLKEENPKKSVFSSVYEWGTKAKSDVSNKELNMYSPVSF